MSDSINAPERTALLVVDPYNDFMSDGGKLYELVRATAEAVGFHANLRAILTATRHAGIRVAVVPHHRFRDGDFEGWHALNASQVRATRLKPFAVGTWGAEWHPEFGPRDGDIIAQEHWAQNGFANTDLDQQLRQHGIENIIVTGFVANTCVEATARYGMELGYHVTVVPDATAAFDQDGMTAARINAPTYAHAILSTDELVASLQSTRALQDQHA
jgi:nicotinamidase-related amidase